MTQYLIALWDYTAEGEFELSFQQGDRIKLLEKHNDDWWEGELNDSIGFFPANRVRLDSDAHNSENNDSEDAHIEAEEEEKEEHIPPISNTESAQEHMVDSPLLQGWEYAYDDEGMIYYFNESTGESSWEKPSENEIVRDESTELYNIEGIQPGDLQKLQYDQLQPEWIRHQGFIQMKMVTLEKQDKLSSWKVYYGVLSNGFLLLYKEQHMKKKNTKSHKIPVGSFDLESCKIEPANKNDTKRKHVFIISTLKKVQLFIQTTSDKDFSIWLDAIMRELIYRKENSQHDSDIVKLLKSLTISDDTSMKVNKKMDQDATTKKNHWFNKANNNRNNSSTYIKQHSVSSNDDDVFGGYLQLEENNEIPSIVAQCIKQVEARGLKSVGIYRLSGPASTIQKYRQSVNNKEPIYLSEEHDINTITGLLKLYFRELKNPLMTYEYYEWFLEAARILDYEERMYQLKSTIHSLPTENFKVLEYLMRHLSLVASYSNINKMETSNLALIFSVGLLRSSQEDFGSILMSDLTSQIVEAIIQQVDWFFEKE